MLLLVKDVCANRVYTRLAHAKGSVPGLPREGFEFWPSFVNPSRGIGLDQTSYVLNRMGRGHSNEKVNVVGHSIDAESDTADFADYASKVGMEIRTKLGSDHWFAPTSAEDEMD